MGFGLQLLLLYLVDVGRHIVGMDLGEGVSKVKQSGLFKLLTHPLYKNTGVSDLGRGGLQAQQAHSPGQAKRHPGYKYKQHTH